MPNATSPLEKKLIELRLAFMNDLSERIDAIESSLLSLHDKRDAQYQELYRKVHSLKGCGGIYGLQLITIICHRMEEAMNQQEQVGDIADTCLPYVDLLRSVYRAAIKEESNFDDIEAGLSVLAATFTDPKDI